MSLQKEFLRVPLQTALDICNNQVVPRLTTRNKVIAITSAISLSFIYYIHQKILKPPKVFEDLPHESVFDVIWSAIRGESITDYAQRGTLPLLYSSNGQGLYMVIYTILNSFLFFVY
jgi:hypothetical protein